MTNNGQLVAAMRSSRIITDYRLSQKPNISAGEMYSICVEWAVDHFGLSLT